MRTGDRVGVMGGTFDPIHVGHLAAAGAAADALCLQRVLFIPLAQPPHRPDFPAASGYHRLAMVRLAVAGVPGWEASGLELSRGGPSYTVDTLTALREAEPGSQFFFITGADAFAEVATWRRYPDVLDLAHFVVIARPGTPLEGLRARLPALAPRMVAVADLPPAERCGPRPDPAVFLVGAPTPDVSGTVIRRRASDGASLAGLVPEAVDRYIRARKLYRSDS
jgi:nicotinate-nucleotide adenylyltransferase